MQEPIIDREKKLFLKSLDRCSSDPVFLNRFYSLFITSFPAVKKKLCDTDFADQRGALKSSFYLLAMEGKP